MTDHDVNRHVKPHDPYQEILLRLDKQEAIIRDLTEAFDQLADILDDVFRGTKSDDLGNYDDEAK
jgi:hypothetical protein